MSISSPIFGFALLFAVFLDHPVQGVQSIAELIQTSGQINLDFADLCEVMRDAGLAHMGVGKAAGKDKAEQAALAAISSPLLETSIEGARGLIINITASPDIDLDDAAFASQMISDAADPDAQIYWGVAFNESFDDEMQITVIATGFDKPKAVVPNTMANEILNTAAPAAPAAPESDFESILRLFNNK